MLTTPIPHHTAPTGKAVPQWFPERQRRNLAKDENYRRRVELIQDLDFPTASQVGTDGEREEESAAAPLGPSSSRMHWIGLT